MSSGNIKMNLRSSGFYHQERSERGTIISEKSSTISKGQANRRLKKRKNKKKTR